MAAEELKEGKYIYCVAHAAPLDLQEAKPMGDRGDKIYLIPFNNLACVVSNSPIVEYPVTRENTMAHQRVIEAVMKVRPVLPVRFGTIGVSDQVIVEKVLKERYEELANLLTWVSDKREIGVKVFWRDLQPVLKELARASERVGVLAGAAAGKKPEATYYDRIEIGKKLEELLKEQRTQLADHIAEVLKPFSCDVKTNATYGDAMILNGAFFVPVGQLPQFHQGAELLDQELGENVRIKLVTDAPPFNFVTITIHWEDPNGISSR